ncbi:MAG TPA: cytidine deaminase [Thermoguttaceae bacterium]|nr:cytidine deaminase [Thermoguttaceae bacterium]
MPLEDTIIDELRSAAQAAAENAYCPYSHFPVGASVLTDSGEIFSGCNVENASFGLTVCAERNAVLQAVAKGHRKIVAVVVVTDADSPTPPCGACRQVIHEFGPDAEILSFSADGTMLRQTLGELLPQAFGPDNLDGPDRQSRLQRRYPQPWNSKLSPPP